MAKGIKRPPPPAPRSFRLPFATADILRAAVLLAATLIAYFPALNGGILWDDDGHITRPILRSLDGLRRIWFEVGATQQYYPLLHSAFWVEHHLWGDSTLGYHLINVLLHVTSALLVVAIVRRLELPGAWLAASLFALHPVGVEAVAWISEQKSTLSGAFYLAAALVYLDFDQSRKRSQYIAATILFIAALAAKTVTASLPAALLVVFWWKRGKLDWKRDAVPLVPWFVIGAAAGLTTAWVERRYIGAQGAAFSLSPLQHFLLAGRMLCFYAAKAILPVNLMFFYPHWDVDPGVWWQYLFPMGVLAAAAGLILFARKNRGPLAALCFFAGTLFPVLGFLNVYPFVYSWVADHFQYLALLGIIVPASVLLARVKPERALLAMPAILAILTWREARMYTDLETLYRESIARNPTSWIAHNNQANVLINKPGKLDEAISLLNKTLELKPDSAEAYNNLGSAYTRMKGRTEDAAAEFQRALQLRPKFPEAEDNLGSALSKLGKTDEAIAHFHASIAINPDYAPAHNNLGAVLSKLPGRNADAMAEFQIALELDPNSADARNNMANTLANTPGGLDEAIAQYRTAIEADPKSAKAQSNLGASLSQAGRYPEAVEHLEAAIKLDPENAPAHSAMGIALSKMPGRGTDAIPELQKALQLDPTLVDAHNNYGTLLAQQNRMPEAVDQFQQALKYDPNSAEAHANLGSALVDMPGRFAEAVDHFQTAIRIKPEFAEAHFFLGLAFAAAKGRQADAIREFETAIRLRPDFADAHQNLGILLAHDPARINEALAHFDAALKLRPDPETQALVDQLRRVQH
jgi:tetratricopeptide (TPR) repeat protein